MRDAFECRKVIKSGKQEIVKGKHVMMTPEMREALEEWEQNQKKLKAVRSKKGKKRVQAHKDELSEESESD